MTITKSEATALLEQDRQARSQAAAAAIQAALQEHECDLVALPQFAADGRVLAVVQIVAR